MCDGALMLDSPFPRVIGEQPVSLKYHQGGMEAGREGVMGRALKHREREMFRAWLQRGARPQSGSMKEFEDQRASNSFFVLMVMPMESEGEVTCRWSIPSFHEDSTVSLVIPTCADYPYQVPVTV
jgi:hypothetical protein